MTKVSFALLGLSWLQLLPLAVLKGGEEKPAGDEFSPAAVLTLMEKVADWQLAHPSEHKPLDWTQAAGYTGIMATADLSSSPRFDEAMRRLGTDNHWAMGLRTYMADDYCVGQTYAELYLKHRDPQMIAPMAAQFDDILAHPKNDNLDFDQNKNPDRLDKWSWCDALFMGPTTWIRLYAATGKKEYLDFAVTNWWKTSNYLYDREEHLYFRDSSYFKRREANGKKVFWSRGNGWVLAGLARVIPFIPKDHPERDRFIAQFREMADRVVSCQQPDGLWRSSLLDPESYPLKETSGSGFYCFALAWGINQGFLDRAKFEPVVVRAWHSLVACVTQEGKLTHVQPISADPKKFDPDTTEVYGVGAFLLAGREIYRFHAK